MDEFFFKGQIKIIRKKLVRVTICFFIIGLLIGTFVVQYWRMKQTESGYKNRISELEKRLEFYRRSYVPEKPKGAM